MLDKLKPLSDGVLIKRTENEDKTPGGIIIPDAAKEKGQTGQVLAVGCGRLDKEGNLVPLQVKTGDTVFFGKYAGTEVDRDHLIIRENEILGVVEK